MPPKVADPQLKGKNGQPVEEFEQKGEEDPKKKGTQPAEQTQHIMKIKLKTAQFLLDENKVQEKKFFKPFQEPFDATRQEKGERESRVQVKKQEFLTYATVYFGSKIYTKQEQKLMIKNQIQKKIDKKLEKQQLEYKQKIRKQMQTSALHNSTIKSQSHQDNLAKSMVLNNSLLDKTIEEKGQLKEKAPTSKADLNKSKGEAIKAGEEGKKEEEDDDPNFSILEYGIKNENNMTRLWNTKLQPGIQPDYNDEFAFKRTTENYFTVAIWQRDPEIQLHYKQRTTFLQERYQGDILIGECKVDFSHLVKKTKKKKEGEAQKQGGNKVEEQDKEKFIQSTTKKDERTITLKLENEVVGKLELEMEYIRPRIPIAERRITNLGILLKDFSISLDLKPKTWTKYESWIPSLLVHISQETKRTQEEQPSQTLKFAEEIHFESVSSEAKKIYFEIQVHDKLLSKMIHILGVGSLDISLLEDIEKRKHDLKRMVVDNNASEEEKRALEEKRTQAEQRIQKLEEQANEIPLSYKGRYAGKMTLEYQLKLGHQHKPFKATEFKDIKEVSEPSEFDKKKQLYIQKRQELFAQQFYKFVAPGSVKDFHPKPLSSMHAMSTVKLQSDAAYLHKYKHAKEEFKENPKVKEVLEENEKTAAKKKKQYYVNLQSETINLPKLKIKTPDGSITKTNVVNPNIHVRLLNDQQYNHSIFGAGMSRWNSSATLRYSVPDFTVSKSQRFPEQDPKKLPPGPNAYGNIGIFQDTEAIDKKLEKRRKLLYEAQKKRDEEKSPRKDPPKNEPPKNNNNNNAGGGGKPKK